MFYLGDLMYAIWYTLGEFLIKYLWGDINKKIEDLETSNQVCRSREHELVRQCEDSIQEANETYNKAVSDLTAYYERQHKEVRDSYQIAITKTKPVTKRKDPSKVTKPIKSRAKKKVK